MVTSEQLRELTVANPMLIEITRFRRRFFSFSTGNSMNLTVLESPPVWSIHARSDISK